MQCYGNAHPCDDALRALRHPASTAYDLLPFAVPQAAFSTAAPYKTTGTWKNLKDRGHIPVWEGLHGHGLGYRAPKRSAAGRGRAGLQVGLDRQRGPADRSLVRTASLRDRLCPRAALSVRPASAEGSGVAPTRATRVEHGAASNWRDIELPTECPGRRTGNFSIVLEGEVVPAKSQRDLLLVGLTAIERMRPGSLEKLSCERGRTKRPVARMRELLYGDARLAKHAARIEGGWWVATNNSFPEVEKFIRRAAFHAGLHVEIRRSP